ncbi:hypothetical protein DMA11_25200, partial [Marinilabiliaceae bacterium JC017]
ISTNSCGGQRNEIKKTHCSNFISIEFLYQNSGYSNDSMGQVHLLFLLLISNLYSGFDWNNVK